MCMKTCTHMCTQTNIHRQTDTHTEGGREEVVFKILTESLERNPGPIFQLEKANFFFTFYMVSSGRLASFIPAYEKGNWTAS